MKTTEKIYCIPGNRFPSNFIFAAFSDANAELPSDSANVIIVIPDESGVIPSNLSDALTDLAPRQAFLISSSQVYGDEYTSATEDCISSSSAIAKSWLQTEKVFSDLCTQSDVIATILRVPLLIGTGMIGEMRRRVNAIYRSVYRHIDSIEAHQSVLHARDLPEIILKLKGYRGIFNISDNTDPTTYDIAEALSSRMGAKRIYTVKAKWARIVARLADMLGMKDLGTNLFMSITATRTIDTSRLAGVVPDWQPTDTLDFLVNHTYSAVDP